MERERERPLEISSLKLHQELGRRSKGIVYLKKVCLCWKKIVVHGCIRRAVFWPVLNAIASRRRCRLRHPLRSFLWFLIYYYARAPQGICKVSDECRFGWTLEGMSMTITAMQDDMHVVTLHRSLCVTMISTPWHSADFTPYSSFYTPIDHDLFTGLL